MNHRLERFVWSALLSTVLCTPQTGAQTQASGSAFRLARLKYSGGGDWYNDPSSDVNLLKFLQAETAIDVHPAYEFVEISSENLFSFPIVWLTGHGNIVLSEAEIVRLRRYLETGGFLYVDDDYGLDGAFRREIAKVLPGQTLVELPYSHGIYSAHFSFPEGLPKIHEHDGKPPQGFALFLDGRLVVFYTFESNLGDGWADPEVHADPEAKRREALKMGTNILVWALSH